jgi:hypothetical protein
MGYKHGTPTERFWRKVNMDGSIPAHRPDLGPCWEWTASRNQYGYSSFRLGPRMVRGHRFAYELLVEPIPPGLDIDHLCRNRGCVNPAHLEPVAERINVLRGDTLPAANVLKTHCPYGHPYSPENTRIGPKGKRYCRACNVEYARASMRRYAQRRRAAALSCSS